MEEKGMKIKETIKNIILWIISTFFIITFIVYLKQIPIPSICILIAGVMLLPPINKKIKLKLQEKGHKYIISKNIIIFVFILIFFVNVPANQNTNINATNTENITTNQNKITENEIIEIPEIKNTIETNGTYTGNRENGKKSGTGTFKWNDGTVYEGEWKEDKINGKGKLTIPDKGTYEGYFENGQKQGQGKYNFQNGDIYEGNFSQDKMSGQGKYTFSNGDTYYGEFLDNQFNGQGTYTINGKSYTGTWKNNEYKK